MRGRKYVCDYNELEKGNMFIVTMNKKEEVYMWLQ